MSDDPQADAYADAVRQVSARLAAYWERPMVPNQQAGKCGACDQPVREGYGLFAYCTEDGDEGVCLHHHCACCVRACIDARHNLGPNFSAGRWCPPELNDDGIEALVSSAIRARSHP